MKPAPMEVLIRFDYSVNYCGTGRGTDTAFVRYEAENGTKSALTLLRSWGCTGGPFVGGSDNLADAAGF